jgi:hypothetical protein
MKNFFGEPLFEKIKEKTVNIGPLEKEHFILNEIAGMFAQNDLFMVPFRFQCEDRDQTSHYIIFVSKHILGYTIMKDIMAKRSSTHTDDSAGFEYVPVENPQLTFLYKYAMPMTELRKRILNKYSGKILTVENIFFDDHVGTPFILRNYKDILLQLAEEGLISVVNSSGNYKVRPGCMADHYIVNFR